MRDFSDEQGRTRVFARGVLEVRRGRKPAENAAHRENSHLWMGTNYIFKTTVNIGDDLLLAEKRHGQEQMCPINQKKESYTVNVSSYLKRTAKIQSYKRAVVYPAGRDNYGRVAYSHLTFLQLDRESDCLAHGLEKTGINRGHRG